MKYFLKSFASILFTDFKTYFVIRNDILFYRKQNVNSELFHRAKVIFHGKVKFAVQLKPSIKND